MIITATSSVFSPLIKDRGAVSYAWPSGRPSPWQGPIRIRRASRRMRAPRLRFPHVSAHPPAAVADGGVGRSLLSSRRRGACDRVGDVAIVQDPAAGAESSLSSSPKRRCPDQGLRHAAMAEKDRRAGQMQTAAVTNEQSRRRPRWPASWPPLWAASQLKQQRQPRGCSGDKAALCGPRMSCSMAARVAAPDVERGCRDPVAGKDSRRHWTSSPDCADSISAIVTPDLVVLW